MHEVCTILDTDGQEKDGKEVRVCWTDVQRRGMMSLNVDLKGGYMFCTPTPHSFELPQAQAFWGLCVQGVSC
jgi:hypothetical protein